MSHKHCSYYQAFVTTGEKTWFFVATLRSNDHFVFDRTLDPKQNLFEFFVPFDREQDFLTIMSYYQAHNIIHGLIKLPHR
ncbi:MAG: hypothetical protein WA432_03705 [Candidatus Babeliaceae bacterium]